MSEPVRHIFPWREEESLTSGLPIRRPTVDVGVTGPFGSIGAKALIDTVSPRTVFPRGIGWKASLIAGRMRARSGHPAVQR